MAKYKIAWMPGDGVGNDVMDACRLVLDAMHFDAEYVPADIGWDFWCREGDPLPPRTIEILKKTDCALFGAIILKTYVFTPPEDHEDASRIPLDDDHPVNPR